MVRSVLVYGGGSAGFLAALTLKCRLPELSVVLLCSQELNLIPEGEASTPALGFHIHRFCGLNVKTFYRLAQPLWTIGNRLAWGPRPYFNYVFGFELDTRYKLLPRDTGFYLDNADAFETTGIQSRLMYENKVWLRQPDGSPRIVPSEFAYQLENDKLLGYLEAMARERGVTINTENLAELSQDDQGISGLRLESGNRLSADLYVDASGSASRLLGETLAEPFVSYQDSLFCDRAVIGSWDRGDEPLRPYTTAETMNAGWCWRVEHEQRVSRGYVYSSSFCSDQDAEAEFRAKNPKVQQTRVASFRSGRRARFWVKNVVAVGAAAAYVEPLEATGLALCSHQCQSLAELLAGCALEPDRAGIDALNRDVGCGYDRVRDFLAVHYRFNRRLDTPFWRECLAKVELHGAKSAVEAFQENGPNVQRREGLAGSDAHEFGMEAYLALLVGQCIPYRSSYVPSEQDRQNWAIVQQAICQQVANAFSVSEALALVRSDSWIWPERLYA